MNCESSKEGCSCFQHEDAYTMEEDEEDEADESGTSVANRPTAGAGDSMGTEATPTKQDMAKRALQAKQTAEYSQLELSLVLAQDLLDESSDGRPKLLISEQATDVLGSFDAFAQLQAIACDPAACTALLQSLVTTLLTKLMRCPLVCRLQTPRHQLEHPFMWQRQEFQRASCVIGLVPPGVDLTRISRMSYALPSFPIDRDSMRLRPFLQQRWLAQLWRTFDCEELHQTQVFFNEYGRGRHAEMVGVDAVEYQRQLQSASLVVVVPAPYVCDPCIEKMRRLARENGFSILVFSGVSYAYPKSFLIDAAGGVSKKRRLHPIESPPPAATSTLYLTRADMEAVVRALSAQPRLRGSGAEVISNFGVQGIVHQHVVNWMDEAVPTQRAKDGKVVGEQQLYTGDSGQPVSLDVLADALCNDDVQRQLAFEINGPGHHNPVTYGAAALFRQALRDLRVEVSLRRAPIALIIICEEWAMMMHKGGQLVEALEREVRPLFEAFLAGRLDTQRVHQVPTQDPIFTLGVYANLRGQMEQPICVGELRSLPIFRSVEELDWVRQAWQQQTIDDLGAAIAQFVAAVEIAEAAGLQADDAVLTARRQRLPELAASWRYVSPRGEVCTNKAEVAEAREAAAAEQNGALYEQTDPAVIDKKLGAGSAAEGWRILEAWRGAAAAKARQWRYVSPRGEAYKTMPDAIAAREADKDA